MSDDDTNAGLEQLPDQELGRTRLRQVAIGAVTSKWAYCPDCRGKVQTDGSDTNAMVAASKALIGDKANQLDLTRDPYTMNPEERTAIREQAELAIARIQNTTTTPAASV